jgi:hypothetical protein
MYISHCGLTVTVMLFFYRCKEVKNVSKIHKDDVEKAAAKAGIEYLKISPGLDVTEIKRITSEMVKEGKFFRVRPIYYNCVLEQIY